MTGIVRLQLAAIVIGLVLFVYGIRADHWTIRQIAIGVLAVGFLLRFVRRRTAAPTE